MATRRTILTSQPVHSCELCMRRLLRGEQHEVFIQAGQRRTVCELCAPRAVAGGWLRERDVQLETRARPSQRQAAGLLAGLRRLLAPRRNEPAAAPPAEPAPRRIAAEPIAPAELAPVVAAAVEEAPAALESAPPAYPVPAHPRTAAAPAGAAMPAGWPDADEDEGAGMEAPSDPALGFDRALFERSAEAFNGSEFPRRVAGLARSLGEPIVNLTVAEHLDSAVRIVILWELCWYRYEIDFSEEEPAIRAHDQGHEPEQLDCDERVPTARMTPSGAIAFAAAAGGGA